MKKTLLAPSNDFSVEENFMEQDLSISKQSFWQSLRLEWKWLLAGSFFSFFYANAMFTGWRAGLKSLFIPNLNYPFVYSGDSIFVSWQIQRLMEGSLVNNPRSGYPFGSSFLDYPHSDYGNFLILKLFGMLTGTYYGALNLYILTSFSVVFIASFFVFRAFSLRPIYAFIAALLFSFAPFHLFRLLGHLCYLWYFVVPIYFYYGWKIFVNDPSVWPLNNLKKVLFLLTVFIILSSFGFYYAFFGMLSFIISGIAAAIKHNKLQRLFAPLILSAMLAFGIGINLLPHLIYQHENGPNPEVGFRLPKETETYALKLAPLFFPNWTHRIGRLRAPIEDYAKQFASNETTYSSSLGLMGSLGLVILILCVFSAVLGKPIDLRIRYLSLLIFAYFLIASVGGLNVFIALYITPLVRGWNRISIFISFAALTALFLFLQGSKKLEALSKNKFQFYSFCSLIFLIGFYDQTPPSFGPQAKASRNAFNADTRFIKQIESALPAGSAIYQLPYMRFPEFGSYQQLMDYELLKGFINSTSLKWNHAGVKWREGDLFYRHLAKEPLAKQLEVIKRLGFSGIYIDRRGFSDNAQGLINELSQILGYPATLEHEDKQIVFYRINPTGNLISDSLEAKTIAKKSLSNG